MKKHQHCSEGIQQRHPSGSQGIYTEEARQDYIPYWTDQLQQAHDIVTKAREKVENNPSQKNHTRARRHKSRLAGKVER